MTHTRRVERFNEKPQHAGKKHLKSLSLNEWVIITVAGLLGSPWTFYVFCLLACVSLPQVIQSGNIVTINSWITQTFIQLVALAVLQAFQTISGKKIDKMIEEMYSNSKLIYKDNEALLEIADDMHQLIKVNNQLTEDIHTLVKKPLPKKKK